MNRKPTLRVLFLSAMTVMQTLQAGAQDRIISTFNAQRPILPSSQYTPGEPYQADVWVYDTGMRYDSQYYNKVWAVPDADTEGRMWYEPDYELTDGERTWQTATAPFSSDEYYKDQKSFRWIQTEIMGDIYLRRSFTIDKPVAGTVFLSAGHDDAPSEWYINGVKVHESADGWNNDEYVLLTDEQKALIKTDGSENILAVHVHQNWGGAFADCGLYEADMTAATDYLTTVASGPWDCKYYFLNYNDDIAIAEAGEWASPQEDEQEWISGVGPFSNDANMFFINKWASQVRPILIRRHFNLTSSDIEKMKSGKLVLSCSYDENPKVYLNGTLIWTASGWNDNNYAETTLTDEQKELLTEGDNVMAVSLMQGEGGGHIDYGLSLISEYIPTGIASLPADNGDTYGGTNSVYSVSGVYLGPSTDNLKKGIYIVGGKKKVIGK